MNINLTVLAALSFAVITYTHVTHSTHACIYAIRAHTTVRVCMYMHIYVCTLLLAC